MVGLMVTSTEQALGFASTPHFIFLRADGSPVRAIQGVHPADSLRGALDALLREVSSADTVAR